MKRDSLESKLGKTFLRDKVWENLVAGEVVTPKILVIRIIGWLFGLGFVVGGLTFMILFKLFL